jgi:glycosyltransferase involved in cell wall biosynthesis
MTRTLGVDVQFIRPGRVGGAEHMARNVVCGLARAIPSDTTLRIVTAQTWEIGLHCGSVQWSRVKEPRNRFVNETREAYRQWNAVDAILYPNYFTPPRLGASAPRIATVIHDLQYVHFPQYVSRRKRYWLRLAHEATLRHADSVIAISSFVRDDILTHYGRRWEEKVRTIPNPVSWSRFDDEAAVDPCARGWQSICNGRFILSVAADYPHKNLLGLVRAFAELRREPKFSDVRLVLVGQHASRLVSTPDTMAAGPEVGRLGIDSSVVITGYISDAEIGFLLRRATLFVFPSLFEGFGMPPVEALGMGLPVLVARTTSLPETTLGMAQYIDHPEDVHSLREHMAEMLEAPDRYRPMPGQIARIRDHYDVGRIGRLYYSALTA